MRINKAFQKLAAMILSMVMVMSTAPVSSAAQDIKIWEDPLWNETQLELSTGEDDLLTAGAGMWVLEKLAAGAVGAIGGRAMDEAMGQMFGKPPSEIDRLIDVFQDLKDNLRDIKAEIENLSAKIDQSTLKNDLRAYATFINGYVGVYEHLCGSLDEYNYDAELTELFLTELYSGDDKNFEVDGKSVIEATLAMGNFLTKPFPGSNYNTFGAFDKLDRFSNRWEHQGYAQRQGFRDEALYTYVMFSTMSQLACQTILENNLGDDTNSKLKRIKANQWLTQLKENATKVNEMNKRCAVIEHPNLRIYRDTKLGTDLYVFQKQVEISNPYRSSDTQWATYTKNITTLSSKEFLLPMARTAKFNREDIAYGFTLSSQQPSKTMYKKLFDDYKADNGGTSVNLYNIFFDANKGAFNPPGGYSRLNFATNSYAFLALPPGILLWQTGVVSDQAQFYNRTLITAELKKGGDISKATGLNEIFFSPIYYYGAVNQGKLMFPDEEPIPELSDKIRGMERMYELPYSEPVTLSVEEKTGYNYQWHVKTNDGGYQELPFETGTSYTLPPLTASMNGFQYICSFIKDVGVGGFSGLPDKAEEELAAPTDARSEEIISSRGEPDKKTIIPEKEFDIEVDTHMSEEAVSASDDTPDADAEIGTSTGESGEIAEQLSAPVDEQDGKDASSIDEAEEAPSFTAEESIIFVEEPEEDPSEDPLSGYLATAPVTLRLVGEDVPVPETIHTVGSAEELMAALERVSDGDWDGHTLKLMASIHYSQPITLIDRSLTIDLNGYVLVVEPTTASAPNINPMGSSPGIAAIYVGNDSALTTISDGELNIIISDGVAYGVYAEGESSAQLNHVSSWGGGTAINASDNGHVIVKGNLLTKGDKSIGASCVDGGSIGVEGDVIVEGISSCGAYISSSNGMKSRITIDGSISVSGSNSRGAYLDTKDAILTVKGNVTATDGLAGISVDRGEAIVHGNVSALSSALNARDGARVSVYGNIVSTGKEAVAVSSFGASLQIKGNITSLGNGGTGIAAAAWNISAPALSTQITVDGIISAVTPLRIGYLPVEESEHSEATTKLGYYTFTDGINIIWAKPGSFEIRRTSTDDSSSSGGGRSVISSTPNITTYKQPNMPTTVKMSVFGTVKNGVLSAMITEQIVKDAIKVAQDAAKKSGKAVDGIALDFNVIGSSGYISLDATIAGGAIDRLKESGVKFIRIGSAVLDITFDAGTIAEIDRQSTGAVTVLAKTQTKLSNAARKFIGNRPVFDITVSYQKGGKTENISNFGKGAVTLGLVYKATANENTSNLFGVYVDKNDNPQLLTNSNYDNSRVIFSRNSLSTYGVGYKNFTTAFTDTVKHWAKDNIDFVVSRGLIEGTSTTTFAPNIAITRADFLMGLGKLAGSDVSIYKNSNFTDVQATDITMPYIEWAIKSKIVSGYGNGNFGPKDPITREQMAVMMINYANTSGYKLPVSRQVITFADDAKISAYAKDAVKAIQQAGVVGGKDNNRFDPQGKVTRAEASTILRHFVELIIDEGTKPRGGAE